ncbi:hypothetical protein CHLRE_03g173165v5 [Chlamydomonas reinhardtii]|uniref:BTB domain-containing protein n=1 Tax=Chlamydomonas reinhardtii TaxID=3055 RepID=A0A2K3DX77_CHLRE|nr:uncharacterized protein CHLRE_03g173165v5 [Chlamydomonas reinhardtii]PNW85133.1 hypothetical protein CHLRE_03g173165v5 [Chlamydomonas reinhardtii]
MLSRKPLELRVSSAEPAHLQQYFDRVPAAQANDSEDAAAPPQPTMEGLVWDDWSASVYFILGHAIMRLAGSEVTLVAGDVEEEGLADGDGPSARLSLMAWQSLAPDGAGNLFVASSRNLLRIQLPASWRAADDWWGPAGDRHSGQTATAGASAAARPKADFAVVSTLPFTAPADIEALTFAPPSAPLQGRGCSGSGAGGAGWLVFTTRTALYRLPLPLPASATTPPAPGLFDLSLIPQPLAGAEGQRGTVDGRRGAARFDHSHAVKADGDGNLYTVESWSARVRRVTPDGTVTTLLTDVSELSYMFQILPNGYAALLSDRELRLIDLGLQPLLPRQLEAAGAAGRPSPRSLAADLGVLLDAQPDGTSDLSISVGERRFPCHRAILSARCDYFRQRLAGDAFADGRAPELELPDADPDAFALLLRWLYTGAAHVPADLARVVAGLADRLLLPDLCAVAQAAIADSVSADTVVDSLLWAWRYCEARGGAGGDGGVVGTLAGLGSSSAAGGGNSSRGGGGGGGCSSGGGGRGGGGGGGFDRLLGRLKLWYVCHHDQVAAQAGDSRARLAAEAPHLMVELVDAVLLRSAARGRSGVLPRQALE